MEIYVAGVGGARPLIPVAPAALEEAAARRMSREAAAYILGGAGSEATMAANRAAFARRAIVPRVLRDVAARDLSTSLFGRTPACALAIAGEQGVRELIRNMLGELDITLALSGCARISDVNGDCIIPP